MVGIPFKTEFTLSVDKGMPMHPMKCEFGYYNIMGKVVIPTKDTGDFLKQSKGAASAQGFNTDPVSVKIKLMPFATETAQGKKTVKLYSQCWNKYGRNRITTKIVILDQD